MAQRKPLDLDIRRSEVGAGFRVLRGKMLATSAVQSVHIGKLIDENFAELKIPSLTPKVKRERIRQHCNPMKTYLMEPLQPDWNKVFANPELPLTVDIGSGGGKFALLMAKRNAGIANCLGLDVRDKLVEKCNIWATELNLNNMYFMTTNATFTFDSLMSTYPGTLTFVCILCPDPQFKKRLLKRRIVQPVIVDAILKHIAPGGKIFVQSDVEDVALDMKNHFEQHLETSLVNCDCARSECGWLIENPVGICSEREISVQARGGFLYRLMYERKIN